MQAQNDNITSGLGQPEVHAQATAVVDVDDADQNAETMAVIAFENAIAAKDAANATPNGGWHELAVSSLIVGPGGAKADVAQSADDDEQATLSQVRAGIFPPVQAPVVEPLTNNANATVVHREEIPNPLLDHEARGRRQRFIQRQRQLDVEFFKSTIRPYVPPQREEPIPMSPLEAVIRDPINAIAIQESLSMHIARMRVDRERRAAREAAVAVVPVGGSVSDDEDGEVESSSSIQRRPKEEEEVVERWVPASVVVKKEEEEVDDKRLLRPKREPLAELRLVRVKREDEATNDIKPKREQVSPAAKLKVEDDDDVKTEVDDDECARVVAFLDMLEEELDAAREEALAIAGPGVPRPFRTGPLKRTYAVADLNAAELAPPPPAPAPTTYGRVLADVTHMFVMEEVVVEAEDADGERPRKRRCLLEGEGAEDLIEIREFESDEDYPEDEAGLPVVTEGSMAGDVDPREELLDDGHDFIVYEGPVVDDDEEEDVEIGGLSSDEEENDENVFDGEVVVEVEEDLEDGHHFVVYEGPEVDEAEADVEGGDLSSDEEENDENVF